MRTVVLVWPAVASCARTCCQGAAACDGCVKYAYREVCNLLFLSAQVLILRPDRLGADAAAAADGAVDAAAAGGDLPHLQRRLAHRVCWCVSFYFVCLVAPAVLTCILQSPLSQHTLLPEHPC